MGLRKKVVCIDCKMPLPWIKVARRGWGRRCRTCRRRIWKLRKRIYRANLPPRVRVKKPSYKRAFDALKRDRLKQQFSYNLVDLQQASPKNFIEAVRRMADGKAVYAPFKTTEEVGDYNEPSNSDGTVRRETRTAAYRKR